MPDSGQPPNSTPDPDIDGAVLLLRSAIQSQDVAVALSGAIGLIYFYFSDPRDNQSITDLTHRLPIPPSANRLEFDYSRDQERGGLVLLMATANRPALRRRDPKQAPD
jgi:hypothetical protein